MTTTAAQTDDGEDGLNLDLKLKKLEYQARENMESSRLLPYKTLEERMTKYKRECDERVRKEVQAEISRIKDIQCSQVRIEEQEKYRSKLTDFRSELEMMLKERENQTLMRCREKEKSIELAAYEHR